MAQVAVTASGNCSATGTGIVSCSGRQSGITTGTAPPPRGAIQVGVFSTGGIGFGIQGEAEVVRNEPYQAEAVTEIRQTLADGTHIAQTITATVARDSAGRTMRSQKLEGNGPFFSIFRGGVDSAPPSANTSVPTLTTIFDPVAREHIDYSSDVKTARVLPMDLSPIADGGRHVQVLGRAEGNPAAFPLPGEPGPMIIAGGGAGPALVTTHSRSEEQNANTESLGKRTIEGIEAVGTRRIWTIPKGAIGNDRALVSTEETWYSPKLKLVVLSIRNDPRFGETTYSLRNISTMEPSKSLFQIPAGYEIEKLPPAPPPPDMPPPR
jgi:hypothetical protein